MGSIMVAICSPKFRSQYRVSITKFKGGEVNTTIPPEFYVCVNNVLEELAFDPKSLVQTTLLVTARVYDNDTLFALALVTQSLRALCETLSHNFCLNLYLPYFPYARQDRVCNHGESEAAKVAANFINNLGYSNVYCLDLHSDVSRNAINNLIEIKPVDFLVDALQSPCYYKKVLSSDKDGKLYKNRNLVLVAPDKGAMGRVQAVADALSLQAVYASKKRNANMEIVGLELINPPDLSNCDFLVIDDICDGGRTFVALYDLLSKIEMEVPPKISLYVSHGIFSYGFGPLKNYDCIICAEPWPTEVPENYHWVNPLSNITPF